MGGGTYCQTEYSLIKIDPLKQGNELEGRGRNLGLEQKIESDTREKGEKNFENRGLLRTSEGKLGCLKAFSARLNSKWPNSKILLGCGPL